MPASSMSSARDISETARAVCRVIVIGATNYPHLIDAVLLRSGRLERHFEIGLPDEKPRADIFRFYLRGRLSDEEIRTVASDSEAGLARHYNTKCNM
ncbi:transitional endoplasmic reticulum ATPase [Rhizobium sp. 57MFTsu3.2]|jgi:SpoVK/Ycf46/Vps4 family AAA+-type ATPase|nr:transitional endoplasmic reticulum ATPase [Rhizobium sp. 57MFTsu3.2]